ncbi:hypothetical protein EVAR_74307_1 [Eumeta japonica]|uniref:Uncharacterized protein n=1 Tax=Eumeta variegata TaxID=151549 RepID=A0A4C1SCP4_EUMVA|nr:hypothetical protein EVAR_74307_1 [Eumeta japonica]
MSALVISFLIPHSSSAAELPRPAADGAAEDMGKYNPPEWPVPGLPATTVTGQATMFETSVLNVLYGIWRLLDTSIYS